MGGGDNGYNAKIKHIFVLMMENRSYDHLLGLSEITGTDTQTGQQTSAEGLKGKNITSTRFQLARNRSDPPKKVSLADSVRWEPPAGPYTTYKFVVSRPRATLLTGKGILLPDVTLVINFPMS